MDKKRALKQVERHGTWNPIGSSGWLRVAAHTAERLRAEGVEVKGVGDLWYAQIAREQLGQHIDGDFAKVHVTEFLPGARIGRATDDDPSSQSPCLDAGHPDDGDRNG